MNSLISSKKQTIKLRKQGKSYSEINKTLGISKSTLSTWLKSQPLSEIVKKKNIAKAKIVWARNIINYNRIRSLKYQKETTELINNFSKEVPKVDIKALFWIGLALFWAEGGKREKFSVRFVNSDPIIIKIMMQFFRKICHVSEEKCALRIHLYPNIEEKKAKKFWSEITKLSINQFYKSQNQISKSSKHKRPIDRLPYGTLHIAIKDAYLNKKMKGWLLGLSRQLT